MERKTKSIILGVRIDYTSEGRAIDEATTAAALVVRDQFPTIEEGVKIERVEVWHNGETIADYIRED